MKRTTRHILYVLVWLLPAVGPSVTQEAWGQGTSETAGPKLSADAKVGDLLQAGRIETKAPLPSMTGAFLRLLGWTAAVVAAGIAFLLVFRRFVPSARFLNAGGMVRILGRSALSPRHSIYLIKVANQRLLVVGVSGDRMVTLSEITDPAGVLNCDGEFRSALDASSDSLAELSSQEGVHEGHGSDREEALAGGSRVTKRSRPGEFPPYQREIHRIRSLIQNWKGAMGLRGPRVEENETRGTL